MKSAVGCWLFLAGIAAVAAAQPGVGPSPAIAGAGFRVSDMEKARAFYSGALGYQEAFQVKSASGVPDMLAAVRASLAYCRTAL